MGSRGEYRERDGFAVVWDALGIGRWDRCLALCLAKAAGTRGMLREGPSACGCGFLRGRIESGLVGCEARLVSGRIETEQEPVGGHRHAVGSAVRFGKERQQGGGRTPQAIDARAKRSGCEAELVSRA